MDNSRYTFDKQPYVPTTEPSLKKYGKLDDQKDANSITQDDANLIDDTVHATSVRVEFIKKVIYGFSHSS